MTPSSSPVFPGADPFIYFAEDSWWLITSHDAADGRHLPIYQSRDLETWTFVRGAVEAGPHPESWNRENFWAPEVFQRDGKFYCYYTAKPDVPSPLPEGMHENEGNRVGLAIADRPEGPFKDMGVVIPHGSIDGSPWQDAAGRTWLLFTTEHGNNRGLPAGKIGLHLLSDDLTQVDETPRILVEGFNWQEGAFYHQLPDGQLVLFFSSGAWTNDTYCLRAAWCESPEGPFRFQEEPILQSGNGLIGPGHANWFPGPEGEPWLIFHSWNQEMTAREPWIAPLELREGIFSAGTARRLKPDFILPKK